MSARRDRVTASDHFNCESAEQGPVVSMLAKHIAVIRKTVSVRWRTFEREALWERVLERLVCLRGQRWRVKRASAQSLAIRHHEQRDGQAGRKATSSAQYREAYLSRLTFGGLKIAGYPDPVVEAEDGPGSWGTEAVSEDTRHQWGWLLVERD